ncbi:hypothetical protein [Myxococcus stipitatus]|uniref:hypothetical protein n=1 Tax=Myxococcus stipitatus TaxID=83455 RepID=UPI0030CD74A2
MRPWEPRIIRIRNVLRGRRARTVEAQTSVDLAFDFLRVAFKVYRWHSEASLTTTKKELLEQLGHFERWRSEFESHFTRLPYKHSSNYDDPDRMHPLGLYVISSQFAWHQYKLQDAGPHLKSSMELVRGVVPRLPLEEREPLDLPGRLEDPRFYVANHFYLGELSEAAGADAEAIRHYLEFIECEPAFSPRNAYYLHGDFYHRSFFYPSTLEALKRVGVLSLRSKDTQGRERAKACFEKALELPASHHSPFREYAALLREDGEAARALRLEEEWRKLIASYPKEMSGNLAWAYERPRE